MHATQSVEHWPFKLLGVYYLLPICTHGVYLTITTYMHTRCIPHYHTYMHTRCIPHYHYLYAHTVYTSLSYLYAHTVYTSLSLPISIPHYHYLYAHTVYTSLSLPISIPHYHYLYAHTVYTSLSLPICTHGVYLTIIPICTHGAYPHVCMILVLTMKGYQISTQKLDIIYGKASEYRSHYIHSNITIGMSYRLYMNCLHGL